MITKKKQRLFGQGVELCIAFTIVLTVGIGHAQVPTYVPDSWQKVCQLTGDWDEGLQQYTLSMTDANYSVEGTDQGNVFEHNGKLHFLFGDTPSLPVQRDPMGWTTSNDPENILLEFYEESPGVARPVTVPGIQDGAYEVPSEAISLNDTIYMLFSTDMLNRSVMTKSMDNGWSWEYLYDFSNLDQCGSFIGASMQLVPAGTYDDLPFPDVDNILMWGFGDYRASELYLCAIPAADIETKANIRYFSGMNGDTPTWSTNECVGEGVFTQPGDPQIGEGSVEWHEGMQRYLLLYNIDEPVNAIAFRSSTKPWGPWSNRQIVFEASWGFGLFIHSKSVRPWLNDRGNMFNGGVYGPYMIPRYFESNDNIHTIYYTVSTWNPYQVVLMRMNIAFDASGNNIPEFTIDPIVKPDAVVDTPYSDTITGSAIDLDEDPLSYSKVSGPMWLSVATNGELSGTPSSDDTGLNQWLVEVDDGMGGADQASLEITVYNPGLPGQATNPNPTNDATKVSLDTDLDWTIGADATSHNVYFGTSNPPDFIQNQPDTTFDPGILSPRTWYYWRIDEVNSYGTTTGVVWGFKTSNK